MDVPSQLCFANQTASAAIRSSRSMIGPARDVHCSWQCSASSLSLGVAASFCTGQTSGRNTAAVAALCEVGARVTPEAWSISRQNRKHGSQCHGGTRGAQRRFVGKPALRNGEAGLRELSGWNVSSRRRGFPESCKCSGRGPYVMGFCLGVGLS